MHYNLEIENGAQKLYEMDDTVDALYRRYVNEIINPQENQNKEEFLDKTLRLLYFSLINIEVSRTHFRSCMLHR